MKLPIKKQYLTQLIFVLTFIGATQYLISSYQEQITNWLTQFGAYVILLYALLQTITIVIAPLGGSFLAITMLALYPKGMGVVIIYLITTAAYFINFLLAKKYGRGLTKKILGADALDKIDKYAADSGVPMLIVLKVFQGTSLFDYLSYAAGLTKISLRNFALVNILGGIPISIVNYLILSRTSNFTFGISIVYGVSTLLMFISIACIYYVKKNKKSVIKSKNG